MPIFTPQQLIDRAAAMADMQDEFVTPQQWLDWLNVERRAMAIFTARAGWIVQGLDARSVSGGSQIEITTDLMSVIGVWEISTSGKYRRLTYADPVMVEGLTGMSGPAQYYSVLYDDSNDDWFIDVYPATAGNYRAVFITEPAPFTSIEAGEVVYPMGIEEGIVLRLARRALIKEKSDTSDIDRLIREFDQHISDVCWNRAIAETPTVRNVDRDVRGWTSNLSFPDANAWHWM